VTPAPDDEGASRGDKACEEAGTSSITGRCDDRDAGRTGRAKPWSATVATGLATIAVRKAVSTTEVLGAGAAARTDDLAGVTAGDDFGETGRRRTIGLVTPGEVRSGGPTTEAIGVTGAMIGAATGAGIGAMIGAATGATGAMTGASGVVIGATTGATRARTVATTGATRARNAATTGATRARNAAMIGATGAATDATTGAAGAVTGAAVFAIVVAVCVVGAVTWITGVAVVAAGVVGVGDEVAGTGWAELVARATARRAGSIAWVGGATAWFTGGVIVLTEEGTERSRASARWAW
jgi:hypothetical protein